jgi:acetate kinase
MNILALNSGSSSLKFKLFQITPTAEIVLTEGTVEQLDLEGLLPAAQKVIEKCRQFGIEAVGHRVVHGGARFTEPVQVTPEVIKDLHGLESLDPTHNPAEVALIETASKLLPKAPAVAVFDTAFHRTLPEVAWRYALPRDLADRLNLRRYGFHGLSHQYVSGKLLACLERDPEGSKVIVCHLGNGASVCALRDGKSVDTSMGLTPLEGLVMGTRSGDIDPGLLLYLLRTQEMTPETLDDLLNHRSGLLGLSGRSADVRELESAAQGGDAQAELALEIFAYRVCKYIGAYAAVLEGVDAVAFTGGIGQHSPTMRSRICRRLGFLGLSLDNGRNAGAGNEPTKISVDTCSVSVWMVPTDEELQIARETQKVLTL